MEEVLAIVAIFIALPWIILHYVTRWKTSATITSDDEALLEELYSLAKRLDERMDTVERLVASDNPDFKPARIMHDKEEQTYWQRVRQSPKRTAREIRARMRDIDRRLADVETYYVSSNPRLTAEIERLR